MERKWTPAQKSAIDTRDCNVLVSAAAGSGKTAVLVERIISMITDPDKNIDIDRLVVVTFTKAAAAQMKDKIRKALDSMLDENPGDVNLLRQITLLNNAQITTIDSFCLWIIRNHFPEVNLDPGFRIMDEGEKKLIENDVLENILILLPSSPKSCELIISLIPSRSDCKAPVYAAGPAGPEQISTNLLYLSR